MSKQRRIGWSAIEIQEALMMGLLIITILLGVFVLFAGVMQAKGCVFPPIGGGL